MKIINIKKNDKVNFSNKADYCIGTGRLGLGLQKEYYEQLKLTQEEIEFSYIRGHGIFHDDISIYHEYEDSDGVTHTEYNFTYLDRIFDNYRKLGIKPFLELGFMPKELASDEQTIFYWKGNTTPPKDYFKWESLIKALLEHLIDRYGRKEVLTWPVEVWNEPNLPGFWKDADEKAYYKLYEKTVYAVKAVHKDFKVGGPAICGVDDVRWLKEFLNFCSQNSIPLDFVTRHAYAVEAPENIGHYAYQKLRDPDVLIEELQTSREIIDSFPEYRGMEMHITEFNTSYVPNCPIHDTNLNAVYIAYLLSKMGDMCASYSYWTFGDVFEEFGVPFTPFHGGFGLVANGCIPKPAFWTFQFFKQLQGTCMYRSENVIVMRQENGNFNGVAWNLNLNHGEKALDLEVKLPVSMEATEIAEVSDTYSILLKTVDEVTCNPLKNWHDIGEPSSLSEKQRKMLCEGARPAITTGRIKASEGEISLSLLLYENALIYFEINKINTKSDRGYDYTRSLDYYQDDKKDGS